jgi:hypothetical protein
MMQQGRISDICVIIKKLYSKQVIAYSMALRTLPDPLMKIAM